MKNNKKKTVLIHSNFSRNFTGFGKHKKNLMLYLYKTGKYNLVEAANGQPWKSPETERMPWKCYGTLPNNFNVLQGDDKRAASYGHFTIDSIINDCKPDVYMGIEDIWGFSNFLERPWWQKITPMIWTTVDSLPVIQQAIDYAPPTKHYYVWASFAERAFKEMGYDHVKTLRGCLDTSLFCPLSEEKKKQLRQVHEIGENDFVIGYVFRNQLRKSVPNLLRAFSIFKKTHPDAKLLLHTHWPEAWDIPRLMEELNIQQSDVLTTYFCRACRNYRVEPFHGENLQCPICQTKGAYNTTNIGHGVSDGQLNEVYNCMDVYCHPFTSGGQELPIQEAKLAGLITLVTDYSCGEDSASEESGGVALDWAEYREPGTQFIKASTKIESIVEELEKVYDMVASKRREIGEKARQWVIDNFSIEVVGKQVEEILDAMPYADWEEGVEDSKLDPDVEFQLVEGEPPDELLVRAHKEILNELVDKNSSKIKRLIQRIQIEKPSAVGVVNAIRQEASQRRLKSVELETLLDGDDPNKRIAVVIPQSETDLLIINSMLLNLQKAHPGCQIYVFTKQEFFSYVEDNPACHKCLPYQDMLENPQLLEGRGGHGGLVKAAFFPHVTTQKFTCYIHNGDHKNQFKVKR